MDRQTRLILLLTVIVILVAAAVAGLLRWRGAPPFGRPPHTTTVSPEQAEKVAEAIRMYLEAHDIEPRGEGNSAVE
jgi:hypothetical protein